jgi:hypothetical protein
MQRRKVAARDLLPRSRLAELPFGALWAVGDGLAEVGEEDAPDLTRLRRSPDSAGRVISGFGRCIRLKLCGRKR